MLAFERLLDPGNTEMPECRCGKEMRLSHIEPFPHHIDAVIRVYKCEACDHQMRLTVWVEEKAC